ncbi:hypothetical protein SIN8267_01234 [Sinobacterium norvegicum]|uniref:Uncharacterized protein n=1 Tax=Sinobacterium norvegicum TaxID=1641715 RepID=A0ABN8EJU9_9GAMM|nr:pilin [Sinobacterium norvegicum]CAH0991132.1 hypothetical protein SIN8267_01234 [Sinobacterium norvegicum]
MSKSKLLGLMLLLITLGLMANIISNNHEKKRLAQAVQEQQQRDKEQQQREEEQRIHQQRLQELQEQNRQREALVSREEEQMRLRQEMLAESDKMQDKALRSAKLSQGLQMGTMLKMTVAEYYQIHGRAPTSNREAGLEQPEAYAAGTLAAAEVRRDGVIALVYTADSGVKGGEVYLRPSEQAFGLAWACESPDYRDIDQLISSCVYAQERY